MHARVNTPPACQAHLIAIGGLCAALAFVATEAAAAIHYVDNPDVSFTSTGSSISASFNPIIGTAVANSSYPPALAIGLNTSNCSSGTSVQFFFGSTPGNLTSVGFIRLPVATNTLIDASTGSWTDSTTPGSQITGSHNAFTVADHAWVAYRFKTSDDAGTYLYGWAEFSTGGFPVSNTLYSFAYEDSGAGIRAGATSIPEPGATVALSGLAAFAMVALRRTRRPTND